LDFTANQLAQLPTVVFYRANGQGEYQDWLTPHPDYPALGGNRKTLLVSWRVLFSSAVDQELLSDVRVATNGNYAPGNDHFKSEIVRMVKRHVTQGKPGRPAKHD
jgi:REP-associated tyrosine transposase